MLQRRSIRGFLDEPVPQEVLREVLRLATRAVSAVNAQPWEFAVVTGAALDALREDNLDCLLHEQPADMAYTALSGVYHTRRVEIAKQLLSAMEITREDRQRRDWWMQRGFRFFDAPAAVILYMDDSLDEAAYRFDMGCVTQNICLAAMEFGLGTCVEYQAVTYQRGLRKQLRIPENKRIVCGIAIGYPDPDFPANHVVSTREDVDRITAWHGFPGQDAQ